jgi:hypothetical protein
MNVIILLRAISSLFPFGSKGQCLVYAFVNINLYFGLPSQIIIKLHIVKQMLVTRRPIDLYHSH